VQDLAPLSQSFENINLSLDTQPPPEEMAVTTPQVQVPMAAQPIHQQPLHQTPSPMRAGGLPREALLAKARAYRESQHSQSPQPEQLSMNMDDVSPARLSPEPSRPFESDSLEVPSYLRRKRGGTVDSNGLE